MASPGRAGAGVTCSYDGTAKAVTVSVDDYAAFLKVDGGKISVNSVACGAATVTNTDTISVVGTGANDSVTIALSGGQFAPGATAEGDGTSEIEFDVDLQSAGSGGVGVIAEGGSTSVHVTIGANGINLNADETAPPDADVTLAGVQHVLVQGGTGSDVISGAGGDGTGLPTTLPLGLSGGYSIDAGGDDFLTGGAADDTLDAGWNSHDALDGGAGEDAVEFSPLSPPVDVDLQAGTITGDGADLVAHVEDVFGPLSGATIAGNDQPNLLVGEEADDVIDGRGGNDSIFGIAGHDTITGGTGDDRITVDAGDPQIDGQGGSDTVTATFGAIGTANVADTGAAGTDVLEVTDCTGVTVTATKATWTDETINYGGVEVPPCGFAPPPPPPPPAPPPPSPPPPPPPPSPPPPPPSPPPPSPPPPPPAPKPKPKKVTICYRHHTLRVRKAKAKQLRKHGAKLGSCRKVKKKH